MVPRGVGSLASPPDFEADNFNARASSCSHSGTGCWCYLFERHKTAAGSRPG
ncbi:hypothetical protein FOXG_16722 [Fusarium oxysporum f. sp. lycopersici 4287]|uniref:Uncharacterized protein n=2 Tax=Fusarium oxysporum TaxID=5507 RepID=A0A0J9W987_FUSO4|nr:hypothetical protein FOXG_16659 [Fusarium oxysporum f. sp. lycopersici 4287]XP_018257488.1 hypothetical protein FOXG_16722 [Fusarium oxysporum f. sp. lycopersici 4287]KNB19361.1 hypothetical protein FOXG_16659 [Fusarium oxysporum f. sp. lycopersici 4287]KNB19443.1 hypothetical protein FOXG_16722 [Fusarium oxysporum f. sp. lycopersici 4287]